MSSLMASSAPSSTPMGQTEFSRAVHSALQPMHSSPTPEPLLPQASEKPHPPFREEAEQPGASDPDEHPMELLGEPSVLACGGTLGTSGIVLCLFCWKV